MIKKLIGFTRQITFWFRPGKVPPSSEGTAFEGLDGEINHFRSRKFAVAFSSVLILAFFYFSSATILIFLVPPDASDLIMGFVELFSRTIEILSLIVIFYTSAQAAVDFGNKSRVTKEFDRISNEERRGDKDDCSIPPPSGRADFEER